MSPTVFALTGYIAWFLLLLAAIAAYRSILTLTGKRAANSFNPDGADVSAFSARLCRAHANCYESFPYIGGLLLLALATDLTRITDGLALVVLICRIAQSTTHLISTSVMAVQIRFFFFLVQVAIGCYWVVRFMMQVGLTA